MEQISPNSKCKAIKFLGVYFDQELSFDTHISQIIRKLSTALYFLRSAKNFLNLQSLKHIYYTLFHSHLVYANSVWTSTSSTNFEKVFKLQKAAIRIVNAAKYNAHTEPLFKTSNILPLQLLRVYFALDFMHLKHCGLLPNIFGRQFPLNREFRGNMDRELRDDFEYSARIPRLLVIKKFSIYFFSNSLE